MLLRDGSKRYTAEALQRLLGVSAVGAPAPGDASGADVVVVLGTDYRGIAGAATP